jgi:hypothetical protein
MDARMTSEMKISDNMSHRSFRWHLRIYYALAVLLMVIAVIKPRYATDMVAFSAITLMAAMIFKRRRSNHMLEVYDQGNALRLKLDDQETRIDLGDIEKLEIADGRDGKDWIKAHLRVDSKFGRLIQFYPDMSKLPMNPLDRWTAGMNERIVSRRAGGC